MGGFGVLISLGLFSTINGLQRTFSSAFVCGVKACVHKGARQRMECALSSVERGGTGGVDRTRRHAAPHSEHTTLALSNTRSEHTNATRSWKRLVGDNEFFHSD